MTNTRAHTRRDFFLEKSRNKKIRRRQTDVSKTSPDSKSRIEIFYFFTLNDMRAFRESVSDRSSSRSVKTTT